MLPSQELKLALFWRNKTHNILYSNYQLSAKLVGHTFTATDSLVNSDFY